MSVETKIEDMGKLIDAQQRENNSIFDQLEQGILALEEKFDQVKDQGGTGGGGGGSGSM